MWNGSQLALSAFAASVVFHRLAGPQLLLGSRFPAALLPGCAALAAFCLVNGVLVGVMRLLAEGPGAPPHTDRRRTARRRTDRRRSDRRRSDRRRNDRRRTVGRPPFPVCRCWCTRPAG